MGNELLQKHGLVLPSEEQWEYACRAGTRTPWSSGADAFSLNGYANIADRTAGLVTPEPGQTEDWLDDGHLEHAIVGMFRPNAFGFHDMHGNVLEWCQDLSTEELGNRVARGGGFLSLAKDSRSSRRFSLPPGDRRSDLGIRPARAVYDHEW